MNDELKYRLFQILIYGLLLFGALFQWFGPGLIRHYKLKKERQMIVIGGSNKELENYQKSLNQVLDSVSDLIKEVQKTKKIVHVCTNDSTYKPQKKILLYPDVDYYYFEKRFPESQISYIKGMIKELQRFLRSKNKRYYVHVEIQGKKLIINQSKKRVRLLTFFKPTKEYLDRPIIKMGDRFNYDKHKDSIRYRSFAYSLSQIENLQEHIYVAAITRPYHELLYDDSFKFYITYATNSISNYNFTGYTEKIIEKEFEGLKNKKIYYHKVNLSIPKFFKR